MRYCVETTHNHVVATQNSDCIKRLDEIIREEGGSATRFRQEHEVVNLDAVERKRGGAEQSRTCDFMFGISTHIHGRENRKIVLAECKFRVEERNYNTNFGRKIIEKIAHSCKVVGNTIPIFEQKYVLVHSTQQARRRFASLFQGAQQIIPCTSEELRTAYFV